MMLFGEREDDFPEIDLLDNQSKKTEDMSKFETIIGARNAVTGNIEGASPICINGKLIGDINSTSYVYISKTGSVEGNVTADHLVLLGNITGDSVNVGKLVVTATGVINSDVEVAKLTVELKVPVELGTAYANRIGEVDWVFVAEEVNDPDPVPVLF